MARFGASDGAALSGLRLRSSGDGPAIFRTSFRDDVELRTSDAPAGRPAPLAPGVLDNLDNAIDEPLRRFQVERVRVAPSLSCGQTLPWINASGTVTSVYACSELVRALPPSACSHTTFGTQFVWAPDGACACALPAGDCGGDAAGHTGAALFRSTGLVRTPSAVTFPQQVSAAATKVAGRPHRAGAAKLVIAICACVKTPSSLAGRLLAADTTVQNQLIPSIVEVTTAEERELYDVRLYLAMDANDADWVAFARRGVIQAPSWLTLRYGVYDKDPRRPYHIPFNRMLRDAYDDGADYFVRINDDTKFMDPGPFVRRSVGLVQERHMASLGWISNGVAALLRHSPPNVGVTGPHCPQGNGKILTHDMTHRTHLDIFENYYPHAVDNYYVDDWISIVYGCVWGGPFPNRTLCTRDTFVVHHIDLHAKGTAGERYVRTGQRNDFVGHQYITRARAKINAFVANGTTWKDAIRLGDAADPRAAMRRHADHRCQYGSTRGDRAVVWLARGVNGEHQVSTPTSPGAEPFCNCAAAGATCEGPRCVRTAGQDGTVVGLAHAPSCLECRCVDPAAATATTATSPPAVGSAPRRHDPSAYDASIVAGIVARPATVAAAPVTGRVCPTAPGVFATKWITQASLDANWHHDYRVGADTLGALLFCLCAKNHVATGYGAVRDFALGQSKGWSLFPAACGDDCGCTPAGHVAETKNNDVTTAPAALPAPLKPASYVGRFRTGGERQVLSFSLYNGDVPRYRDGAYENLDLWPKKFPGWELWIYYDKTTSEPVLQRLRDGGAKMIDMTDSGLINPSTWRFTVASDPTVDRYLSRDIDSRLTQRDKDAVDEWVASDKKWHVIRDHPSHTRFPMSAGLWGGTGDAMPDMTDRLKRTAVDVDYTADQVWLAKEVWPIARHSVMQHDSFSCDKFGGPAGGARSFPSPREHQGQHVGSVHASYGAAERGKDQWALFYAIEHGKQPAMCRDRAKGELFESPITSGRTATRR